MIPLYSRIESNEDFVIRNIVRPAVYVGDNERVTPLFGVCKPDEK